MTSERRDTNLENKQAIYYCLSICNYRVNKPLTNFSKEWLKN